MVWSHVWAVGKGKFVGSNRGTGNIHIGNSQKWIKINSLSTVENKI